jgi:hypothetical protein
LRDDGQQRPQTPLAMPHMMRRMSMKTTHGMTKHATMTVIATAWPSTAHCPQHHRSEVELNASLNLSPMIS